jgi:hypothetical protein
MFVTPDLLIRVRGMYQAGSGGASPAAGSRGWARYRDWKKVTSFLPGDGTTKGYLKISQKSKSRVRVQKK